jgi:hypothetical protein
MMLDRDRQSRRADSLLITLVVQERNRGVVIVVVSTSCTAQLRWLRRLVLVEGQATLRQSLLVFSHSAVGVDKDDLAVDHAEGEGSLVTSNTLQSEALEDLFQGRLRHAILLDAQATLLVLKLSEEPADGLVFFGDAELEELAALLQQLDLLEVAAHPVDNFET